MNVSDHSDLIEQYAHVCNRALLASKDRFPFKQILGAAQAAEKGSVVEVRVEGAPLSETYIFELTEDGVVFRPHGDCASCDCDRVWGVSKLYLEQVSQDPESFVENPAKIDWGWMYGTPN